MKYITIKKHNALETNNKLYIAKIITSIMTENYYTRQIITKLENIYTYIASTNKLK